MGARSDKRFEAAALIRLSDRQHGLVSRGQLEELGLTRRQIEGRIADGRLLRVRRAVYAVGHRPRSDRARWLSATLALGDAAVLSHHDAAALWGVLGTRRAPTHVSVPGGHGSRTSGGIVVHRVALGREDRTRRHRIPVTTPARTLFDIAVGLAPRAFERAVDEACYLRLVTLAQLAATLDRNRGRPGAAVVAALLHHHELGSTRTRSELEELLLGLCRKHGLPAPRSNQRIEGIEVDFLWPAQRLVVEVDGFGAHASAARRDHDHARDALLDDAGYRVRRFSDRQLKDRPEWVAATLRRLVRAG